MLCALPTSIRAERSGRGKNRETPTDKGIRVVGRVAMPSNTKKTEMKRKRKRTNLGKARKKVQAKQSTPAFAVHAEKDGQP